LNAIITFAFGKFTSNADEIDRFSRVTMGLRCKGCGKWDDIVINDIIVKGVLPSTKNCLELVCVVVVEVDIFRSERTQCSASSDPTSLKTTPLGSAFGVYKLGSS